MNFFQLETALLVKRLHAMNFFQLETPLLVKRLPFGQEASRYEFLST